MNRRKLFALAAATVALPLVPKAVSAAVEQKLVTHSLGHVPQVMEYVDGRLTLTIANYIDFRTGEFRV